MGAIPRIKVMLNAIRAKRLKPFILFIPLSVQNDLPEHHGSQWQGIPVMDHMDRMDLAEFRSAI